MCKATLEGAACLATKSGFEHPSPKVYVPNTNNSPEVRALQKLVGRQTKAALILAMGRLLGTDRS